MGLVNNIFIEKYLGHPHQQYIIGSVISELSVYRFGNHDIME